MRALALLLAATPAAAQEFVSYRLLNFETGIICAIEPRDTSPAPDTVAGDSWIVPNELPFVSQSRTVPASFALGFGLRFEIARDAANVTAITLHPPFTGHNVTRQSTVQTYLAGTNNYRYYQFDFSYELVPGDWTLEAWDGDALLYRTHWTVIPDDGSAAGLCDPGVVIS